jgi:hypothetical protein
MAAQTVAHQLPKTKATLENVAKLKIYLSKKTKK